MRRLILTFFIFVSIASGQNDRARDFLKREMAERKIPGLQAAVVKDGRIVFLESFGIANIQNSVAVTNKSVFPIFSCTKAFTGVAIMQLVEEGKLDLSAPISKYLDGLPAAWQPVTIRQLLTHISGLPNVIPVLDRETLGFSNGQNEDAVWAKVKELPMEFETGTRFSYNQTNYALLGKIIDKLTGKPFVDVFAERQFDVALMPSTRHGDSRDVIPNMVSTYRFVNGVDGKTFAAPRLVANYVEFPPFRRTASGLNSTAEDLAKWIMALLDGKLLKPESRATLWKAGAFNNGHATQWALGWVTKPRPTHSAITATGGTRAAIFVYPEDRAAVVILTNLTNSFPEDIADELAGIYNPAIAASDPVTALRIQLRKRGFDKALDVYRELKAKDARFNPLENDLNDWAYRLMNGGGKPKEALEIFKLNVFLYPQSANTYDSLADAYNVNGDRPRAIENYKKSLELDPKNKRAAEELKRLEGADE
ncbi:MAG TPA: serine hydrolase [Pyrinomonadaceae bacterium]|nr:serine hydrolase [Pyrinomonadaceae bacterium]